MQVVEIHLQHAYVVVRVDVLLEKRGLAVGRILLELHREIHRGLEVLLRIANRVVVVLRSREELVVSATELRARPLLLNDVVSVSRKL